MHRRKLRIVIWSKIISRVDKQLCILFLLNKKIYHTSICFYLSKYFITGSCDTIHETKYKGFFQCMSHNFQGSCGVLTSFIPGS